MPGCQGVQDNHVTKPSTLSGQTLTDIRHGVTVPGDGGTCSVLGTPRSCRVMLSYCCHQTPHRAAGHEVCMAHSQRRVHRGLRAERLVSPSCPAGPHTHTLRPRSPTQRRQQGSPSFRAGTLLLSSFRMLTSAARATWVRDAPRMSIFRAEVGGGDTLQQVPLTDEVWLAGIPRLPLACGAVAHSCPACDPCLPAAWTPPQTTPTT